MSSVYFCFYRIFLLFFVFCCMYVWITLFFVIFECGSYVCSTLFFYVLYFNCDFDVCFTRFSTLAPKSGPLGYNEALGDLRHVWNIRFRLPILKSLPMLRECLDTGSPLNIRSRSLASYRFIVAHDWGRCLEADLTLRTKYEWWGQDRITRVSSRVRVGYSPSTSPQVLSNLP